MKKEQALHQAIQSALSKYGGFCLDSETLDVQAISEIQISNCRFSPSSIDISNLEECTGGTFDASLRIEYKIGPGETQSSCYQITGGFDVLSYQDGVFCVEITNEKIYLR